jgi:hypothetical protein
MKLKTIEIDLNKVLEEAMHHMADESDVRWSVGMALQELYPDQIGQLQQQMIYLFKQGNSK